MASTDFIGITKRNEIEVRGVKDILSYESDKVVLQLEDSNLIMNGSNFNVKKIDVENQTALIIGCVDSLLYSQKEGKRSSGFLLSLFK